MDHINNFSSDVRIDFEHYMPKDAETVRKSREICFDFQNGSCTKSNCTFRHALVADDPAMLRSARTEVCKYWLRGLCTAGDDCPWLHEFDMKKIPECIYHQKLGECSNPECIFQHKTNEERVPRCAAYDRGFCGLGPKCTLRHVKQQPCPKYLAGFCPQGTKCNLGHPAMLFFDEESIRSRIKARMIEERREGNLNVVCDRCRDPGHIAPRCPGREKGLVLNILNETREPGKQPSRDGCYVCGERDHTARVCPKRREQQQRHYQQHQHHQSHSERPNQYHHYNNNQSVGAPPLSGDGSGWNGGGSYGKY
eukprot:PhM_4_TR5679/c0_g1_i1/m.98958/K14404/CPSF4, YTH1; cleavage and polyadenylation specificity factor subunit 4